MKILVLSDSHSALSFMRRCMNAVKPDVVIHLGDHFDDGESLREEFSGIPFYQVPGNCDRYRCHPDQPEILIPRIGGVDFYMTHGHHGNPQNLPKLPEGSVFLYGHTHVKFDEVINGIRCLNPGGVSIPKDGSHSCLVYEDGQFRVCILEA